MKSTQGAGLTDDKTTYFRLIIILPKIIPMLHQGIKKVGNPGLVNLYKKQYTSIK